jgi:hypothetical protein
VEQIFSNSYYNPSTLHGLVNQSSLSGVLGALWFSQRENHTKALFSTLASKRGAHAEGGPLGKEENDTCFAKLVARRY